MAESIKSVLDNLLGIDRNSGGSDDYDNFPTRSSVRYQQNSNTHSSNGTYSSGGSGRAKIIDMSVSTKIKMANLHPTTYNSHGECREIADTLKSKRCVMLTLESMGKSDKQRMLDFMAGFIVAIDGVMKRVGTDVYFVGPYDLDFQGGEDGLMAALEESLPWD